MEKIVLILKEFGIFIGVGLVGLAIMGYGVIGSGSKEEAKVEIVRSGVQENVEQQNMEYGNKEILVDIAGGVEKPGLYKLQSGSRIGDVIVMAGGFSQQADLDWVAQTLNLAEVLKDGGKVYIPIRNVDSNIATSNIGKEERQGQGKVNINTASVGELDSLAGIGEVRAKAIVDNRPYSKLEELVSKAKIPESVFEKIKDQVSVY